MSGPLEGVKVLDLTAMISGPTATMILACLLYTSPSPRD